MFASSYRRILHIVTWVVAILFGQSAYASFHLWEIAEIYSNASGKVQYIELTTSASGQQFVAGHEISALQDGTTHLFSIPADLPGDSRNHKFLIATQGFASLGIVAPDYVVPDGFLFQPNGSVNFAGVDVMTYGNLPSNGVSAMDRAGNIVVNAPTNFAGATSTIGTPQVLPQCALTAIPAVIAAGASSTLTSSCSPAATSYTWTGGTCAGTGLATCTVTPSESTSYTVAGINGSGAGVPVGATVTVNALILQTISFTNPGARTLGEASLTLNAVGGASGSPVTFSSLTSSVCTVSGTTVTLRAAGICAIAANQAGNADYSPASQVLQSFTVSALISQTISFPDPGSTTIGTAPFALNATGGSSGNPVTYSSLTPSICFLSGTTVTPISVGTCTITANQSGNAAYSAAPQATQDIAILPLASALGQYDGIYQWSPGNYLSLHQDGAQMIATIYFNVDGTFAFGAAPGGTLSIPQLDLFDLLNGSVTGATAKIKGTRFHRACNVSYDFAFGDNATLTATRTGVSNTAIADAAGISCGAIVAAESSSLKMQKVLFGP